MGIEKLTSIHLPEETGAMIQKLMNESGLPKKKIINTAVIRYYKYITEGDK